MWQDSTTSTSERNSSIALACVALHKIRPRVTLSVGRQAGYFRFAPGPVLARPHGFFVLQSIQPFPWVFENHSCSPSPIDSVLNSKGRCTACDFETGPRSRTMRRRTRWRRRKHGNAIAIECHLADCGKSVGKRRMWSGECASVCVCGGEVSGCACKRQRETPRRLSSPR